ncbi:late competence development ComFB family protein [Okeania sp.]|uniref:late competence development ComFB family protein n=1 Tax=Okeania sp. TaxID=3100323 RepID=UPI002B4B73CA|nr:late competence development ComFB family protein [Okeania sp.]MEB3340385.1 late competence development ComFB family protein [Okeania sp.]
MGVNSNNKYVNIMEKMVAEEVTRQIAVLPKKLAKYIKQTDVETYALNRLPPLYASSKEGWNFQTKKAEEDYEEKIAVAVRHALAAIQRDLLKSSTPIFKDEHQKASSSKSEAEKSQPNTWRHGRYYRLGSANKYGSDWSGIYRV